MASAKDSCPGAAWTPDHGFNGLSGLYCLVDTTAYGVDGWQWCAFQRMATGTASVYPIKAKVPPGRGSGQWKPAEVRAWHHKDPRLLAELVDAHRHVLKQWDGDEAAGLRHTQVEVNRTLWPRNVRALLEAIRESSSADCIAALIADRGPS